MIDMEKTLQEVLRNNKLKEQKRKREGLKRLQRQKRIESVLTAMIIIFIMTVTILLIKKTDESYMNSCTKNHSYDYCEARK
jgi:mRNA-degrading endonuclease RelE of RelBE toxin-antitoxin system